MASSDGYARSNLSTYKYCFIVGLGAVLFGIDQGCMVGLLAVPRFLQDFGYYDPKMKGYNMKAGSQTLIYGLLLGGVVIACMIAGPIGSRYGRRVGLALCAITSIIGPVIQIVAPDLGVVVFGRAISGAGIGFAANFCIMYWAEIAQANRRGLVTMQYQGFINLAQFLGACINYGTHTLTTKWAWRGPLMVMILAPIILGVCLPFIPDTPRWFVHRGRITEAHEAMCKIRGPTWPEEEIKAEIREVVAMDQIEREIEGSSTYLDCFKGTDHRRTRVTIMVLVVQQFSGISFITAYGTYFFLVTGIQNPFTITVITSVCGLAGSASAFPLVRYCGRRSLMVGGSAVCAFSMLIFAIVGVAKPNSIAAARCLVAFTCLYIFTYGATLGPVPQAILGEMSSNRLRSKTVSIATTINWLITTFIVCGMPYLLSDDYADLGTKVGFIFGGITTLGTVYLYMYLPETKDRTLEQIDEMFLNHVPAREFSSYVCTGEAGNLSMEKIAAQTLKGELAVETVEVA